jgi:hypothetical protein
MATSFLVQDANGAGHVEPVGPVQAYTTHEIVRPLRIASCQEAECDYWETGLTLLIDTRIQGGPERLIYLRDQSGRRISGVQVEEGVWKIFVYPHQSCFRKHRLPVRDESYVRRMGDWRGNPDPGSRYKFKGPDDWVDSFANNLDQAATRFERG